MANRSFSLSELAERIGGRVIGDPTVIAAHVTADSRKVAPGSLFVAIPGTVQDGHLYLDSAFEHGASAAVVTNSQQLKDRPGLVVTDARSALSSLSALFAGDPSNHLTTIGVTGTNGKTTTNWIIQALLESLSIPTVRLGTLGIAGPAGRDDSSLTTPDSSAIHTTLANHLQSGAQAAVLEVSSIALDQQRTGAVAFDAGVFTNLTRDHLDYHQDFESYFQAKCKLFTAIAESTKPNKVMVINGDDPYGHRLLERFRATPGVTLISYGGSAKATFQIENFQEALTGLSFTLRTPAGKILVQHASIGWHNALNITAALATLSGLGYPLNQLVEKLPSTAQAPGRLESVGNDHLGIYIDYAHTPDGLENVLTALRPLTTGSLWCLFGCGGDRDRGKRPQMLAIARRLATQVVVTSDNPRTEDPSAIIRDILATDPSEVAYVNPDRAAAIQWTVAAAKEGDIILIAGKGHEDYQILGTEKIHFSDQEHARAALQRRGSSLGAK